MFYDICFFFSEFFVVCFSVQAGLAFHRYLNFSSLSIIALMLDCFWMVSGYGVFVDIEWDFESVGEE